MSFDESIGLSTLVLSLFIVNDRLCKTLLTSRNLFQDAWVALFDSLAVFLDIAQCYVQPLSTTLPIDDECLIEGFDDAFRSEGMSVIIEGKATVRDGASAKFVLSCLPAFQADNVEVGAHDEGSWSLSRCHWIF